MASTLDVTIATERHLVHHQRESRNRLASGYTAADTSLALEFDSPLPAQGQQVAVDFEVFEVWGAADKTVTVEGGQEGSTPADHATGAHVVLSPKFPRNTILKVTNDVLADLSTPTRGLFQVVSQEITVAAGVEGYELDAEAQEVYDVEWRPVASSKGWESVHHRNWRAQLKADLTDFPSGKAIFLDAGIPDGYLVRVTYKAAFSPITATTADVAATSGLAATAVDILDLGAAVRLMAPLEPARNYTDAQGDTRRAEEVPAGAQDRSVRALLALRDDRIKAEAARLREVYPSRSRR